jgi:hypothetical protein
LIAGALIGTLFSPFVSVANGQSPTDLMSMMNGNETGMGQNMSMPQLNMGIVTMPVACTTLGDLLGSITGMTGAGGNESQENIMDMMQKMMPGGMSSNMTEADMQEMHQAMNMTEGVDMQHIMNMQFCSLMTDEKMMEEMQ